MGLKIVLPEFTRNLCTNPSLGVDTTGWSAWNGSSIARDLTRSRFGRASLKATCPGVAPREGADYPINLSTFSLTFSIPITCSIYARGFGRVFLAARSNDNGQSWDGKPIQLNDRYWQRLVLTGQIGPTPETDFGFSIGTFYNHPAVFWVDGAQIELLGHVTTYCDGDQELELAPHDGQPYFEWVGQRHATQSFRSKTFRGGGEFKDLSQGLDVNAFPIDASGLGMPPISLATQVYSGREAATIQSVQAQPRAIGLTFHAMRHPRTMECDPQSLMALHQARRAVEHAMKPDLTHKPQPFVIRYQDVDRPGLLGCPMDLDAIYESGLEWDGDLRQPYHNAFGIRLFAPNPYWQADSQDTTQLLTGTVPATEHAYLIARLAGQWDGFGSASFPIRVLAVHPNGDVYAGGDFENIGGVACRRIARWDGTAWNILAGAGNDIDDGSVYAIAFAPNGDVYIGGTFTTIGAATFDRVARYDPAADTFTVLGAGTPGVNSDVNALAVDKDGQVYLGGAFTQANDGPVAAWRIVRYNGPALDTWTALGPQAGLNLDVEALEIDLDGSTLYLGGQFTNQEGIFGPALLPRICLWNGTAFADMAEFGMNGTVRALRMGLDGRLFIGGDFTTAGFWTVAKVAYWDRNEFYPLGGDTDGLTGGTSVNVIAIDSRGNVYFGGDFTAATEDSLAASLAIWNGSRFLHTDIVVGHEVLAIASKFDKLFVGYDGASVTSIADVQTVDNGGAASAFPILDVLGPLTLRWLENQDTGKVVRMNLDVQAGERVLIDLRPGFLRAISEWRGNVVYGIMAGSDWGDFALLPGQNQIAFLGTDGDGNEEVSLRWRTTDWSFDDLR
jgi:hypothetical protein